jgi:hypothetical protein
MKIIKVLLAAAFVVAIAGFAVIAVIDVPVQQRDITFEINNEG